MPNQLGESNDSPITTSALDPPFRAELIMNKFSKPIHELVKQDLDKRAALGKKKYGQYLYPHNGRSALQDAFEEACDLCCYLKQALLEQEMESKIKKIRETPVRKKREKYWPF